MALLYGLMLTSQEFHLPFEQYLVKKVLIIEALEDTEECDVWEMTAGKKRHCIDAENGIVRRIIDF